MAEFPLGEKDLKLGVLGGTDGNGHPYSLSAIFNDFDSDEMKKCPFKVIPRYLKKQPRKNFGIAGVKVTHVCCVGDGGFTAEEVAKAALIPNVVDSPEEFIDKVDAVIVATDKGYEHVKRCQPFVEAGLPMFVDKPLVDNGYDLDIFRGWEANGAKIISFSSIRCAEEFEPYHHLSTNAVGELRLVTITTSKSWERYGVHALEGIYPIVGPGFLSVINTGTIERNVVHLKHKSGVDVIVIANMDMCGGFGLLQLAGTTDSIQTKFKNTFRAFKKQMELFVEYLRTGVRPFPSSETFEIMNLLIAGKESRDQGGREIFLKPM